MVKLPEDSGFPAFVAQRIEHLTTDQKVGGSSPSKRTTTTKWAEIRLQNHKFCLFKFETELTSIAITGFGSQGHGGIR